MSQQYHIGIDLGTTFSSLAYVDAGGNVEPLRLADGKFQMASAIYFQSPTEIIVGSEALNFAYVDASRVARAFKRQMGNEEYTQFTLDGEPIPFAPDGKSYRPEELSAMVLRRLLDAAESQLGPIERAVISVPYVFDEKRRLATQNAGRIAGLKEIDIVDEPVAAAVAYGNMLIKQGQLDVIGDVLLNETILVYDLGGGTFDVTLVKMQSDGTFEVLATDGDERLGGEDWDKEMLGIIVDRYKALTGKDPSEDNELLQELRIKAVAAKETLSTAKQVEITFMYRDREEIIIIPRIDFIHKTKHLVTRTQSTLEQMLERKELSWSHIDRPLMVGGSSRMPMIYRLLEQCMNRDVDRSLSPDTAIAMGAALVAAQRGGLEGVPTVETVNSHALGLMIKSATTGKVKNDVIIPANEKTGTKVTRTYAAQNDMKALLLAILQGDSPNPNEAISLGKGGLRKLPPGLTTEDRIEVTFSYGDNGMLHVEGAIHRINGESIPVVFDIQVEGKMSEEQVDDAITTLKGFTIDG